jgi:hypothetical protein
MRRDPDPFSSSLLKDKPTTHAKCEPFEKRSTTENILIAIAYCSSLRKERGEATIRELYATEIASR